MVAAY